MYKVSNTQFLLFMQHNRTLHKRKTRDAEQRLLVEGRRLVSDALQAGLTPELILVTPEALYGELGQQLSDVLEQVPNGRDIIAVTDKDRIRKACDTVTPQGVVAVMQRPHLPTPTKLGLVLVLDSIRDPGNLGTLIRTAAGLGADAVVLSGDCVDIWSPKSLRSSMGAAFRIPNICLQSWSETKALLGTAGVQMFAADGNAELTYYNADWSSQPSALVVGAEADGLCNAARQDMLNGAIVGLKIPLANSVESLNAAVAGAIMLSEAQRQRQIPQ
jgi:RNA methyltransferase, TrmH family